MFFAEASIFNNRNIEIVAPSPKNNNPNISAYFLIIAKLLFMFCSWITSSIIIWGIPSSGSQIDCGDGGAVYRERIVVVALGGWRARDRWDLANQGVYIAYSGHHFGAGVLPEHIYGGNGGREDADG